jgi:DNA adenine methylase Dam
MVISPLNYTGGKSKLLPQLLDIFPKEVDIFVDLFCGGGNVCANIDAGTIIANDKLHQVIELLDIFTKKDSTEILDIINNYMNEYQLTTLNSEGYLKLRRDYNADRTWDKFYTLVCYSFNNQIRFNSKGEYNMPFCKNRSSFNQALQKKLIKFVDKLKLMTILFISKDFRDVDFSNLTDKSLVYCDPPYLITTASYNEQNGWSEKDEHDLLDRLDELNSKGVRFALSNVLESKGLRNEILIEWCQKYHTWMITKSYKNCNHQKKDDGKVIEVLITNYF